jgi:hypothetical protein
MPRASTIFHSEIETNGNRLVAGQVAGSSRALFAGILGRVGHRMRRRELLLLLGGAVTGPRALHAQQKAMPVIGHRMRRRDLLLSTLAVLSFAGSAAFAQGAEKVYRVGVLASGGLHPIESFRARLRELGWIEGRNIRFDYRSAEGDDNRQPALAEELAATPVDLILTWGTPAALAAKRATATIPIVMTGLSH